MKRIICLMMALLMMMPSIPVYAESIPGTPYNEENYDVTVSHVMINQIYAGGYCDYSFIELYNPTEQDIDLSTWSLHYIPSMEGGDSVFSKLDLTGTIPAHCSYLVRCNKTSKVSGGITLNSYDQEWDQVIYTKGCSVVLMSNQEKLETTEVFNGIPLVEGYVDMLGMSGNDGIDEQKAICFESEAPAIQSKKKGIRRDHFMDCDDNANDTMIADYSFGASAYIDYIRPRSSAEGVWEDGNMPTYTVSFDSQGGSEVASQIHVYYTAVNQPEDPVKEGYIFIGWYHGETEYNFETLPETDLVLTAKWETEEVNHTKAEITALKAKVPKYLSYYTSASVRTLNTALSKVNSTDLNATSQAKINELYDEFETALNNLQYKTSDVPVVYVTTNDEVGANLQKADGYVYTDLAIVDTKGKVIEENDTAQIKVRGNSTANAPKKPYNVKFSSKQNVLGMGKAKKWTLLANAYDVTLLRNYLGLDIGQHLGLDYTSEHEMVDVYVDGVLKGSYLLAESVEAGSSRVDIDIDQGEFLLEYDKRNEEGVTYLRFDNQIQFQMSDPDEPTQAQANHAKAVMDDILDTMMDGDYEELVKKVDVESFAKFFVANTFMKTADFNFSSVYFYYKGGKLYAGPMWDLDFSAGDRDIYDIAIEDYNIDYVREYSNLYRYLTGYPEFREMIRDIYLDNSDYFASIGTSYVQSLYEKYKGTIDRNYSEAGWKVDQRYESHERPRDKTYQENLDYLKKWLNERHQYLMEYFNGIMVHDHQPTGCLEVAEYKSQTLTVSGYAFDYDFNIIKETIEIYANDQYIGTLQTGIKREDVNTQNGLYGHYGFEGSFKVDLPANARIKAYAMDIDGNKVLLSGIHYVNASSISSSYTPKGSIDTLENPSFKKIYVEGSAYDEDDLSQSIIVNVYVQNQKIASFETDDNHQFNGSMNIDYLGTQTITFKAVDLGTNKEYTIGTKTITLTEKGIPTKFDPNTYVDVFTVNTSSKTVNLGGWAFDRDDVQSSVSLKLYVGDTCIATILANQSSSDVNNVYALTGKHRYSGTYSVKVNGTAKLSLKVVDLGSGEETLVYEKTVTFPGTNLPPIGCVDAISSSSAGEVYVAGWAFDKDSTSFSTLVKVYIGSTCIGTLTADQVRDDVNSVYGITGKHGFSGTVNTTYTGSQKVVIKAVDISSNAEYEIGSKTITIKKHEQASNYEPKGVVDLVMSDVPGIFYVAGWVFDKDDDSKSLDIRIYAGDELIDTIKADQARDDVNSAFGITGDHGYRGYVETDIYGVQTITIKAVDLYTNKEYTLGSVEIEIEQRVEEPDVEEPIEKDSVADIFSDVVEGAWYEEYVQYVYDHDLMKGYTGTDQFGPNDAVTRAQMVQVLYNFAGNPEVTSNQAVEKFDDVLEGQWYCEAINWAYENGITVGMDEHHFGVDIVMNREQMVKFLMNYVEKLELDVSQRSDIEEYVGYEKISEWAKESMSWAVEIGIITGAESEVDGMIVKDLDPSGTSTRAQLAKVLTELIKYYQL